MDLTSNRKSIICQVDKLVSPAIESLGCELIEIEYLSEHGRWILRLYIDSVEGGVTLKDCERVSRAVSALLDGGDVMPGRYNLEVSSPGIERPVRRVKDFEKYAGSVIKVRTYDKICSRRNFKGVLKGVEKGVVRLFEGGEIVEIPIEQVFKARLQDEGSGR